jgi:hypothetical protein
MFPETGFPAKAPGCRRAAEMLWTFVGQLLGKSEPLDGRVACWMAALGLAAGGVKATLHRNPQTTWLSIVAAAIGSSVASMITGFALLYAWGPEKLELILALCGIAGWIGVALLDMAAEWCMGRLRSRFGGDDEAGGQAKK